MPWCMHVLVHAWRASCLGACLPWCMLALVHAWRAACLGALEACEAHCTALVCSQPQQHTHCSLMQHALACSVRARLYALMEHSMLRHAHGMLQRTHGAQLAPAPSQPQQPSTGSREHGSNRRCQTLLTLLYVRVTAVSVRAFLHYERAYL